MVHQPWGTSTTGLIVIGVSALLVTAARAPASATPSYRSATNITGGGGQGVFHGAGRLVPSASVEYATLPGKRTTGSTAAASPALHIFGDSFTYGTQSYRYRMVGADPKISTGTTTTPVVVIPVKIVLSDGTYTYPFPSTVTDSALFKPARFTSGTTQYGDAMQRAEFWKYTAGDNYHSLLGTPTVKPQVSMHVPAGSGQIITLKTGVKVIGVDLSYFNDQLATVAETIPANVLPLFISWNNVLYRDPTDTHFTLGYHTLATTATGDHTYAYAAWQEPASFGVNLSELVTHSHEVAEWYNDPYGDNMVPQWSTREVDCKDVLEVGDPVTGHAFTATALGVTRHYQDEAFLSYFTRTIPSIGIAGRYTYLATYNTFSSGRPNC